MKSIRFVEKLEKETKEGLQSGTDLIELYYQLDRKTPFLTPELKETRKELLGALEQKIEQDPVSNLRLRAANSYTQRKNHSYFSRRRYDIRRNAKPSND